MPDGLTQPGEINIIEERSWYHNGYVVVSKEVGQAKGLWHRFPYRRFKLRWRGGWITLPWERRLPYAER